jgi:hypothetical protein
MTAPEWRLSTCRPAAAVRISRIAAYVSGPPRQPAAPIDAFYATRTTLLQAAQPNLITAQPVVAPLLLVGFVSATENYFRDVLAGIVSLCPVAQTCASQERISLGTVLWHGGKLAGRGAFELISFTSAENVKSTTKKYAALDVKRNGPLDAALVEYEKICELRHGIVHSGGVIAGKNALKLELSQATPETTIGLGFAELQECAEICSTVVAAANAELFSEMVTRWATKWRHHSSWDESTAAARFSALWDLFHSVGDAVSGQVGVSLTKRRCFNLVRREFKL